jgi:hypothetical protein
VAISNELVSIMLLRLKKESKGGVSICLKTFWLINLGLILWICLYLDSFFCTHFLVYVIVIFLALILAVLAKEKM